MNLTTKGRYAVMAMIELALRKENEKAVSLQEISDAQEIPRNYLEQLFASLRASGIVASIRGAHGGYRLNIAPKDIAILDIIKAAEESISITRCSHAEKGCMKHSARCLTHDLWAGLESQIEGYLASVSLQDVCDGKAA
jgi:Rrf2 family iron-sulfur cluster assembly transcriptional regulator